MHFSTPSPRFVGAALLGRSWISFQPCSTDPVKPQRNHQHLILGLWAALPALGCQQEQIRLSALGPGDENGPVLYNGAAGGKFPRKAEWRAGGSTRKNEEELCWNLPEAGGEEGTEMFARLAERNDLCSEEKQLGKEDHSYRCVRGGDNIIQLGSSSNGRLFISATLSLPWQPLCSQRLGCPCPCQRLHWLLFEVPSNPSVFPWLYH